MCSTGMVLLLFSTNCHHTELVVGRGSQGEKGDFYFLLLSFGASFQPLSLKKELGSHILYKEELVVEEGGSDY